MSRLYSCKYLQIEDGPRLFSQKIKLYERCFIAIFRIDRAEI